MLNKEGQQPKSALSFSEEEMVPVFSEKIGISHILTLSTITSPRLDNGTPLFFKKSVDGITPSKNMDKQDSKIRHQVFVV